MSEEIKDNGSRFNPREWDALKGLVEYVYEINPALAPEAKAGVDYLNTLLRKALASTSTDGQFMCDWPLCTLKDAYKPRPPVQYAVVGLFSLPSLNIVYGAPSTLKTMLGADLAISVAGGQPWLPPMPGREADLQAWQTREMPVLWLDFDNGRRRMDERFEALGRARELPDDIPLYYTCMPVPWLDGSDLRSVDALILGARAKGIGLIIIDNLIAVSGRADENSAEMANVLANFRRLAEESGAAIVLIHHQRKSAGFKSRAGESLRGHSSIEAALDLALLIEREEHSEMITVRSTKTRDVDILPFGAMFTYEHKEHTTELKRAHFYGRPVEDIISDAAIRRTILEVVADSPQIKKTDLVNRVKEALPDVGYNRIRNITDNLAASSELKVESGNRNAKLYSLATGDNLGESS